MHETSRSRLVPYGVAVLATAASLLIRWPLRPVLGEAVPHMTFFPAVMIAAYFGGFWPGLLATILSAAAASHFLRSNKALTTYFGLSDPAQALGKTDFDFFTAEHARPAYADEQEIIRTGQPVVGKEEKETWLDGRVRWVSTTRMPFRDNDGQIIGTFGLARDIT